MTPEKGGKNCAPKSAPYAGDHALDLGFLLKKGGKRSRPRELSVQSGRRIRWGLTDLLGGGVGVPS